MNDANHPDPQSSPAEPQTNGAAAAATPGAAGTETVAEPTTLYEVIGGAEPLRALVDRFYDLMDLEPEFALLRSLHPTSMDGSRDKLFWFLSGWSGGPDLYVQRHGHPRLRARHLPYAIATPERDQWLRCMAWAMQDTGMPAALKERLLLSFFDTADWMRNKPD